MLDTKYGGRYLSLRKKNVERLRGNVPCQSEFTIPFDFVIKWEWINSQYLVTIVILKRELDQHELQHKHPMSRTHLAYIILYIK